MPIDITNKEEKQIALTGVEIEETLLQAHLSKDAIAKIKGLEASASEINTSVSSYPILTETPMDSVITSGLAKRINVWTNSEDQQNTNFSIELATKSTDTITRDGILFTKYNLYSFSSRIRSLIGAYNLTIFNPGDRYLISYYAFAEVDAEIFVAMRKQNSTANGHTNRILTRRVRRLSTLIQAVTNKTFTFIDNPTIALGSDVSVDQILWLQLASSVDTNVNVYVGGFQIEKVSSTYKNGIAMIGDSTISGSSGYSDLTNSREISTYLAAFLNASCFNRAIGGRRLVTIDSEYVNDVTPIASNCKYVVIEGGINDFGNGATAESVKGYMISLVTKAKADGLIPIILNCTTGTLSLVASQEAERLAFNTWLMNTFPNVIDIASVIANPNNISKMNTFRGWNGDGVHYQEGFKREIALKIANSGYFDFIKPSSYQKIVNNVWSKGGGLTSGTGTALTGSFSADTATATQAAQRVLALENILRTNGIID